MDLRPGPCEKKKKVAFGILTAKAELHGSFIRGIYCECDDDQTKLNILAFLISRCFKSCSRYEKFSKVKITEFH